MSIRIVALYMLIAGLSIYAWKDWFKSLCGLILLMALVSHPDMPTTVFGIQGFNPWNILFLTILPAWFVSRSGEGLKWDMPGHIFLLVVLFFGIIFIGFLRAAFNPSYLENYSFTGLVSEQLFNNSKWLVPALLLFDGCRTRKRVIMALSCLSDRSSGY